MTDDIEQHAHTLASRLVETLPGRVRDGWYAMARAVLRRVEAIVDEAERGERIAAAKD